MIAALKRRECIWTYSYVTRSLSRKPLQFIVILVDHEFNVFDLEGKLQGKVSSTEYGVPVQINEDSFILCKDRTVTWITNKGDVLKARELTEEEHQALKQ